MAITRTRTLTDRLAWVDEWDAWVEEATPEDLRAAGYEQRGRADALIAGLETERDEACAECEQLTRAVSLYASEIKDAGAEIERLRAELDRRDAKPEKVSETCRRTGVQACHICDDLGCGDNMSAKEFKP